MEGALSEELGKLDRDMNKVWREKDEKVAKKVEKSERRL